MTMARRTAQGNATRLALVVLLCAAWCINGCPGRVGPQRRGQVQTWPFDKGLPREVEEAQERVHGEPASAEAHVALGEQYARQGLPELALAEFQAALNYAPGYGPAVLASAAVTAESGDLHRALWLAREAVVAMPYEPVAYLNLGQLRLRRRECAYAQDAFARAKKLDESDEAAWLGLITACLEGGQPELAAQYAEEAMSHEGLRNTPELQTNYGLALERLGRYEAAEEHYRAALEADPTNPLPMNNLAYMYASLGTNLDEALQLAEEATRLRPRNASCIDTLGYVLCRQRRYETAVAVLEEAKALRPTSGTVRYHLGLALEALGATEAAAAEFGEAVRRDPNAPGAADADRRRKRLAARTDHQ